MTRRKLFFDEKSMSPDLVDVLEAAGLLQVTEFQLFGVAYRWWFGKEADPASIERLYLPYMFHHQVPGFVRQFARLVLQRADAGRLDPREFGIMPRPLSMDMYDRGLRYMVWIVVIMGTLLTGAIGVAELTPWYQSCYFPPCI